MISLNPPSRTLNGITFSPLSKTPFMLPPLIHALISNTSTLGSPISGLLLVRQHKKGP